MEKERENREEPDNAKPDQHYLEPGIKENASADDHVDSSHPCYHVMTMALDLRGAPTNALL